MLLAIPHLTRLGDYSHTRLVLASFYRTVTFTAQVQGHTAAAFWFAVASLVNYLHVPGIGALAASEGSRWIPDELTKGFWRLVGSQYDGGARLD